MEQDGTGTFNEIGCNWSTGWGRLELEYWMSTYCITQLLYWHCTVNTISQYILYHTVHCTILYCTVECWYYLTVHSISHSILYYTILYCWYYLTVHSISHGTLYYTILHVYRWYYLTVVYLIIHCTILHFKVWCSGLSKATTVLKFPYCKCVLMKTHIPVTFQWVWFTYTYH